MLKLIHDSQWTVYVVDYYYTIEECIEDCERRYGVHGVTFTRDKQDGILKTIIYADEDIQLKLYEEAIV